MIFLMIWNTIWKKGDSLEISEIMDMLYVINNYEMREISEYIKEWRSPRGKELLLMHTEISEELMEIERRLLILEKVSPL